MRTEENTTPSDIGKVLTLLRARAEALAAMHAEAQGRNDAFRLMEIGGRQAEVSGLLLAIMNAGRAS